jgi:hypothetical protein
MATKKSTKKKRVALRISLPELLSIVEKAYDPDGYLDVTFDEITGKDGRIPQPSLTSDTLAEFLIRELGDVYRPRAGAATNVETARDAVHSAIEQLMDVETALLQANYKEGGYFEHTSSAKLKLHSK